MQLDFKKSMYTLVLLFILLFQGCGGGSSSSSSSGSSSSSSSGSNINPFKYNKISIAGSSITWGNGNLGENSYVGEVIKYFREEVADTIGVNDSLTPDEVFDENMSYGGKLFKYDSGSQITGELKASDKITLVFAIKDGIGATVVEMLVDGVSLGEYDINSNNDILPVVRIADVSNERDADGVAIEFRQPFRENNIDSVKTWDLADNKDHNFTLKVKSGTLLLNYITNHMYYFQNAGVGGYTAKDFLRQADELSTTQEIIDFNPDLFIFESSTNDANIWDTDKGADTSPSTNNWIAQGLEFTIESANQIKISRAANINAGDMVVMGNYSNTQDINDIEVGIVKSWDSGTKTITFTKDMSGKTLVLFCQIKSITGWENNVKEVISKVVAANPNVKVGIGTSGVPNLGERKLMGYREKGQIMAIENGWMFFDFFEETRAVESAIDIGHLWSVGDNTHPNENGYRIFGSAVIDVLKVN